MIGNSSEKAPQIQSNSMLASEMFYQFQNCNILANRVVIYNEI